MTRYIACAVLAVLATALLATNATPAIAADASQVDVCCAWNEKLADGVLTYKVSGATRDIQTTITDAIEDWDAALTGLSLEPVSGDVEPDIVVRFRKGGGTVQGQAHRKVDRSGFVSSASIHVSSMAFGVNTDAVYQITLHEVGHALGAGHADGDGVLMSPTVAGGVENITTCDRDAVIAANEWFFGGGTEPAQPSVDSVPC